MFKTILYYIVLALFRAICFIPSIILFPFAFPFRVKAYDYCKENGPKGFHILQIINWFFTKEGDNGDWYAGPTWYMSELKLKTFNKFVNLNHKHPFLYTYKEQLIYFYICYKWGAIRNYMWNLNRLLTYEGGYVGNLDLIQNNLEINGLPIELEPQCKFKDEFDNYRDNSGPYILYPGNFPTYLTTIEGSRFWIYKNKNNQKRFYYCKSKVFKLTFIKRFLAMELKFGWYPKWGSYTWHSKFMFKKMDEKALKDYRDYKEYLMYV